MTTDARTAPGGRTSILLVPHTHWDREWYRPFQSFRTQLVDLVDRVLDMLEADPDFAFTLDGQLATIDDYLEIRPQNAERIARFVQDGRLAIGPWQILMDEFLVSGETIVRNLEMGWRRAEELGEPMCVGYLPDMFGHIAQMPQILRRAGIADAVVWRGVPAAIDRHAFAWEAPDGSVVRAEYLSGGYGNAVELLAVPEALDAAATRFTDWAKPWFGADPILAMYGTDHTAPVPELAALVSRLNELQADAGVRIGTLADYLRQVPALEADAPRWRGELRAAARANMLMGVTSARVDIKQAAGRVECLLERYVEPLCAVHLPAAAWPDAFLRIAWRRVIENSAHDSICGCSADPVVAQVLVRYAEAQQLGEVLARRAILSRAASAPRGCVVVVNASPVERVDVVDVELGVPEAWDGVALELPDGRRVPTQEVGRKEPLLFDGTIRGAQVRELFRRFHGREIFDHAWNGYRIETDAPEGRLTFEVDVDPDPEWLDVGALKDQIVHALQADPERSWRVRVLARARRQLVAAVRTPPLGWTAARPVEADATDAARGADPSVARVTASERTLDNGLIVVTVGDDGTFTLVAADGARATGVGRLVDGGDFGDSYNYAPPREDRLVDVPVAVEMRVAEVGPVRARIDVVRTYEWPAGLADEGARRSSHAVRGEVLTAVELRLGEPFVRIRLSWENRSDDHRLRFHLPLPRPVQTSHAEGQFAVVERGTSPEGGYREKPLATYPAHSWVDAGGMAVLLEHVTEYELLGGHAAGDAAATGGRELAITILRSTGLLSRNVNPYRLDPAGPQLPIPASQLHGPHRFAFALMPHGDDWRDGGVPEAAERYRLPFRVAHGAGPRDGAWPPAGAGEHVLSLIGRGVVLAAVGGLDGGADRQPHARPCERRAAGGHHRGARGRPHRTTGTGPERPGRRRAVRARAGRDPDDSAPATGTDERHGRRARHLRHAGRDVAAGVDGGRRHGRRLPRPTEGGYHTATGRFAAAEDLSPVELEQQLATVPLLAGLEPRVRRRLADVGKRRTYQADETIVKEGSTGTALYIVLSGQARVEKGAGERLGELRPGDFFGELALIEEHPRSASVIAETQTECLLYPAWEFSALLDEHPEIAVPIMRALIARLHRREQHAPA